jgi:CRP-like cAMP-binding protein
MTNLPEHDVSRPAEIASFQERGNELLQSLDEEAWAAIKPHLKRTSLAAGEVLEKQGQRPHQLYFPLSGAVSFEAGAGKQRMQLALVGREGMVGTSLLLEGLSATHAVVQFEGAAWRVPASELSACLEDSRALHWQLLQGFSSFVASLSLTALANSHGTIEQRLARWLLTAAKRLDTDVLHITHEKLSKSLGVRRSGVTVILHVLERKGAVIARRGQVHILNGEQLIVAAGPYRPHKD